MVSPIERERAQTELLVDNQVLGTQHVVMSPKTRAEVIESLLFAERATAHLEADTFGSSVVVTRDKIVLRFYPIGDPAKARAAMEEFLAIRRKPR